MVLDGELRRLDDKLNGIGTAVESGFREVKKDVGYLARIYIPLSVVCLLSLVIAVLSMSVALENRAMILAVSNQAQKNARELELISPLIPYITSPAAPDHLNGK